MAKRNVYFVNEQDQPEVASVDFKWFPGFSRQQAHRSIASLHQEFLKRHPQAKMMEISSASQDELGKAASAFNLQVQTSHGSYTVEQVFQAGKVFKQHGSQERLLHQTPREAKRQIQQLNRQDQLVGFEAFGTKFPLKPTTYFYNWTYLKALHQHHPLSMGVLKHDAFTDIYFNPTKSINCQAEACSIYVSLFRRHLLEEALATREDFLRIVYGDVDSQGNNDQLTAEKTNKRAPIQEKLFENN